MYGCFFIFHVALVDYDVLSWFTRDRVVLERVHPALRYSDDYRNKIIKPHRNSF